MISRIRTIKPELFRNSKLFEAEQETKLPIRVCWTGLLTVLDREGRFEWKPRELKLLIAPYDDIEFSAVLNALVKIGKVVPYRGDDGELYGIVPTFLKHQAINTREAASLIPAPTADGVDAAQTQLDLGFEVPRNHDLQVQTCADTGSHVQARATAQSGRETPETNSKHAAQDDNGDDAHVHARACTRGREGKGREGNKTRAASGDGFRLPDWIPRETWDEFEKMRDRKRKPMTDLARELIVKELGRLRDLGNGAAAVLEQSIVNSWQDVYELRRKGSSGSNGSAPKRERMSATERAAKMGVEK